MIIVLAAVLVAALIVLWPRSFSSITTIKSSHQDSLGYNVEMSKANADPANVEVDDVEDRVALQKALNDVKRRYAGRYTSIEIGSSGLYTLCISDTKSNAAVNVTFDENHYMYYLGKNSRYKIDTDVYKTLKKLFEENS